MNEFYNYLMSGKLNENWPTPTDSFGSGTDPLKEFEKLKMHLSQEALWNPKVAAAFDALYNEVKATLRRELDYHLGMR